MSFARLRRTRPRTLVYASVLLLAVVLTGCMAIDSYTISQRLQGYVTLRLAICASDGDRDSYATCDPRGADANTEEGDNGFDADEELDGSHPGLVKRGQLLVGFRVPNGAVAPTTFQSSDASVSMTRSATYTTRLTARFPPPGGFRWEGYISADLPFDARFPNDRQTILVPEFALPPGDNGAPFVGPFRWRAVIGIRKTGQGGVSPVDPVTCDNDAIYVCFDSPQTVPATHIQHAVSDIGVHRGATATVVQGETASVEFPIQNLAPTGTTLGNRTVNLSASTTVPGASAAPAGTSLNLIARTSAAPTQTTTVTVPIPPNTPVGTYAATLTASANSGTGPGLVRSNTATIQVVDRSAPAIRVSTPSDGATFVLGQSVPSDYGCTEEPGGTGLNSCAGPVPSGEAIDTSSVGEKTFTVTSSDNGGNTSSLTRTYSVVAPAPVALPAAAPGRINFSLPFGFSAAASTKFNLLQVKNIPSGSLVEATCKGTTCPKRTVRGRKRAVTFTKRNASGTVSLTAFRNKSLRAGTVLTVTVTKPGSFGMVKKVTMRKNRRPAITTTCLQPNSKASAPCT